MQPEETFDAFYESTRRDLLLQSFALTGDARAARSAVRDAYAGAWLRWHRVSRLDDPLTWVRPRAWRLARRRHATRLRRATPGLPRGVRSTLTAVSALPPNQRRMLLLVDLAGLDLAAAAAEAAVPADRAADVLGGARATLAGGPGSPAAGSPSADPAAAGLPAERLRSLGAALEATRLPRGSLVRRGSRGRRRGPLLVGAAAATLLALGADALGSQPQGAGAGTLELVPAPAPSVTAAASEPAPDSLLDGRQVRRLGGGSPAWQVRRTDHNTAGAGLNTLCQRERYADPRGRSTLVRTFAGPGGTARRAVQTVELSRSVGAAARGFRTTRGWYAGCRAARVQVQDSYRVDGIGDEATVLRLRVWTRPATSMAVAIARSGRLTTSTVSTTTGTDAPTVREVTRTLAAAVRGLCPGDVVGGCVRTPTVHAAPPPPSGSEPGILAVADLPPADGVDRPWVGTDPARPRTNPSSTSCDRAAFASGGATTVRARTFLVPGARLPVTFGLSQTYGEFRSWRAAARFVAEVRRDVAGCEKRDLATEVGANRRRTRTAPSADQSHWDLAMTVSDREKVHFHTGLVRVGRRVAQVTFSPSTGHDLPEQAFDALLLRAGDRLRELP